MDRLQSMQAFCRVADRQGFAAAARDMDLSPSVVTRLIAELENHLGARLLHRSTRKVVLTEVGEAYLHRVRRLLAELDEAESLVASSLGELQGHLKVLVPPAFAAHQLAPALPGFLAQHPRLTIELSAPGQVETLDEAFDVSILTVGEQLLKGDFVARPLARSKVVMCASPGYLDRHGRPSLPADLAHHRVMMPHPALESRFLHEDGREVTVEAGPATPARTLVTAHMQTSLAAAIAGLGVGGFPSYVVVEALNDGRLERVLPEWHLLELAIHYAIPSRKHVPAKTRAFLDFLVATFGAGDGHDPWLPALGR